MILDKPMVENADGLQTENVSRRPETKPAKSREKIILRQDRQGCMFSTLSRIVDDIVRLND